MRTTTKPTGRWTLLLVAFVLSQLSIVARLEAAPDGRVLTIGKIAESPRIKERLTHTLFEAYRDPAGRKALKVYGSRRIEAIDDAIAKIEKDGVIPPEMQNDVEDLIINIAYQGNRYALHLEHAASVLGITVER